MKALETRQVFEDHCCSDAKETLPKYDFTFSSETPQDIAVTDELPVQGQRSSGHPVLASSLHVSGVTTLHVIALGSSS
ncbi:hypothetical protein BPOR_0115g00200 [Botrytis porri]|uniref:Uncharacterized protein n=1 Tax=Botrytis porri TaxID=87229 RepID=A0A4Z1KXJ6_9HELO|nr:hypothetical protein BPOR_0115g00200 [Botrytis porri]